MCSLRRIKRADPAALAAARARGQDEKTRPKIAVQAVIGGVFNADLLRLGIGLPLGVMDCPASAGPGERVRNDLVTEQLLRR